MSRLRVDFFRTLEAGIVGLFFIQAARFAYATIYARASSADLVQRVPANMSLTGVPGVIEITTIQNDLVLVSGLMLLPLLALIFGRWGFSFPATVLLIALGRSMALQSASWEIGMTGLVLGAGFLYLALTAIRRPAFFPTTLLLGIAGDQLIRTYYDTYDRTWQGDYTHTIAGEAQEMSLLISLATLLLIVIAIFTWYIEHRYDLFQQALAEEERQQFPDREPPRPPRGRMNIWGGLALGAVLYLELTLMGLPNAVAHWSGVDYAVMVPWLIAATLLPLIPEVRKHVGRFAGMFDSAWRGWLWGLLLGLLLVVGRLYDGILSAFTLIFAQFMIGLSLWWLVNTRAKGRGNLTGITILLALFSYGALAVGDYFTYDYAYVRDLRDPYQNVSELLRSFRDMGLGLTLIAALVLSIPMILTRRGLAWSGGYTIYTFMGLALVIGASFAGAAAATGDVVRRPSTADCLRIATLNLHGGYSQYFDPNLERAAQLIELNGADVVLLQEVDTGRMASYGVDQVLWLSRRLQMEWAFYPQNELLQGIAVLSRLPIVDVEGLDLPSTANQAAAMHVTLDVAPLVADPKEAELGPIHIYNAWLGFHMVQRDGQPVPDADQDQNRQLDQLLGWIAQNHSRNQWNDRIVVGGTLNFPPESPLYSMLTNNGVFKDPFVNLLAHEAMTVFRVDGVAARYDYLFTPKKDDPQEILPLNHVDILRPTAGAQTDYARMLNELILHTTDHRMALVEVRRHEGVQCPQ